MARLADIIQAGMGSVRQEEENARQGTKNALLRVSDKLAERASYERSAKQLSEIWSRELGGRDMVDDEMVMEEGVEGVVQRIQTEKDRRMSEAEGLEKTFEEKGRVGVEVETTRRDRLTGTLEEFGDKYPNAAQDQESYKFFTSPDQLDNSTTANLIDSALRVEKNLKILDTYKKEQKQYTTKLAGLGDQAIFDSISNLRFDVNKPEESYNNLTKTYFQGVFDYSENINNMNKAKLLAETGKANIKKYEGIFSADNTLARMAIMQSPDQRVLFFNDKNEIIPGTEDALLRRIISVQGGIEYNNRGRESALESLKEMNELQVKYFSSDLLPEQMPEVEKGIIQDIIRGLTTVRDGELVDGAGVPFEVEGVIPSRALRYSKDQKIKDIVKAIDDNSFLTLDIQKTVNNFDVDQSGNVLGEALIFTGETLHPEKGGIDDPLSTNVVQGALWNYTDKPYAIPESAGEGVVKPKRETSSVENLNLSPKANRLKAKFGGGGDKAEEPHVKPINDYDSITKFKGGKAGADSIGIRVTVGSTDLKNRFTGEIIGTIGKSRWIKAQKNGKVLGINTDGQKDTIVVKYDDGVIVQYKNVNSKLLKRGDKIQGGSIITVMLGGKNDEEGYVDIIAYASSSGGTKPVDAQKYLFGDEKDTSKLSLEAEKLKIALGVNK